MTQRVHPQHPPHHKLVKRRVSALRIGVATMLSIVVAIVVMPAPVSAATKATISIERQNGVFVILGSNFPASAVAHIEGGVGKLSGTTSRATGSDGSLWEDFRKFGDECGDAYATVEAGGVTAKATTNLPCATSSENHAKDGSAVGGGSLSNNAGSTTSSTSPPTTSVPATQAPAPPAKASAAPSDGYKLVYQDDFNGTKLDEGSWGIYEGSGNAGVGYRKREAISVSDGALRITGRGDVAGGVALNKELTYGRYEVRAKTDKGAGYGPAALLWPVSERWPVDGEIDISEVPNGNREMSGSYLHWGSDNEVIGHEEFGDFSQWHTFAVDWEPSKITFYVDGAVVWTVTQREAIPTTPHFLGLQLDIGDGGFIDARNGSTPSSVTYHVDYVKIFQK